MFSLPLHAFLDRGRPGLLSWFPVADKARFFRELDVFAELKVFVVECFHALNILNASRATAGTCESPMELTRSTLLGNP